MTQRQLGEKVKKSESTINLYESEKRDCGVKTLIRLCHVLKTDPNKLLGFTSNNK